MQLTVHVGPEIGLCRVGIMHLLAGSSRKTNEAMSSATLGLIDISLFFNSTLQSSGTVTVKTDSYLGNAAVSEHAAVTAIDLVSRRKLSNQLSKVIAGHPWKGWTEPGPVKAGARPENVEPIPPE